MSERDELHVGTVLAMDRAPNPRWNTPAGRIRWEVVGFSDLRGMPRTDERQSIPFSYDGARLGPQVWLRRLDNLAARSQPAGSHRIASAHSVWWMLNGGGYRIEDGTD